MTCKDFQQLLISAEKEGNLTAEARQHLTECPDCQAYSREQRNLKSHVRGLANSEHAPEALRERVAEILRQSSQRRLPRLRRLWFVAAATVALVVGAGAGIAWYFHGRSPSADRLAQEFIVDHLNYLPGREQIVSESPQKVEEWFQGRVDFSVRVPEVPGTALEDARVCDIAGRKAALVHYRRRPDDTLISLFVSEPPGAFGLEKQPVSVFKSYEGLNATLWSQRGLVYSLVGPVDEASLNQIAESVRKQEP